MRDIRDRLLTEFNDEEARREYADEFLDTAIALQIKALRQQRGWNQSELGRRAGKMKQQQVSQLERVDYASWTIQTLKRLAAAFDLVLQVKFESFGELLNDAATISRESLERPSFADDPVFRATDAPVASERWEALSRTMFADEKPSAAFG